MELAKPFFCHGTPRDENEVFTRLTSEERLISIFENIDADVILCGHTHMQFDRYVNSFRVVNAGSIGMQFGEPGAYWVLLDNDIRLMKTDYELRKASDEIVRTKYPHAKNFAENSVINPPSEPSNAEYI